MVKALQSLLVLFFMIVSCFAFTQPSHAADCADSPVVVEATGAVDAVVGDGIEPPLFSFLFNHPADTVACGDPFARTIEHPPKPSL